MDKLGLNWRSFEENIRECFKTLRQEQRLFDVTLATDDGQNIKAHKIILSAGSHFFNDIFMKSNHKDMLIYLQGISSAKLEPVIEFLYNGETFITQEEVKVFLDTGKELKVKGLEGELTGIEENHDKKQKESYFSENELYEYDDYENDFNEDGFSEKVVGNETVVKTAEANMQVRVNNELLLQVNQMIEKNEGVWRCKVCGKIMTSSSNIRRHAEIHIEGMSYSCNICNKTYPNRHGLRSHISGIHSELFSCDVCGKSDMNRKSYQSYKDTHLELISCDICGKSGLNKRAYRKHESRQHKTFSANYE